jgi:hypothetical protein
MDINYIILAHKNPAQLNRLVEVLSESWTKFYIHIDRNQHIAPFQEKLKNQKTTYFLEYQQRESTIWGDIGIVKATLNALEQIIKDKRQGYCILLSGQDYPLRKNKVIRNHLFRNSGTIFMDLFQLPGGWQKAGLDRIHNYKLNKSRGRGHFLQLPSMFDRDFYSRETAGKINFLRKTNRFKELRLVLKKRKFPNPLEPYGGSQWWALPMENIQQIIDFVATHPSYLQYHKYTLIPDEIFFHSIIVYLNKENNQKIEPALTYLNWDRPKGPLPVTFVSPDLDELQIASKAKLFARKFDINKDEIILNLIDDYLRKE